MPSLSLLPFLFLLVVSSGSSSGGAEVFRKKMP